MKGPNRGFEAIAFLSIAGLCAWLVRCLTVQQKETMDSISKATKAVSDSASDQMTKMTTAFSTATGEITGKVSGLAETLILGRDLPNPNESLPTSSTESEPWSEPEIALSDLPVTATWAEEEEEAALRTGMPPPSYSPPNDLD